MRKHPGKKSGGLPPAVPQSKGAQMASPAVASSSAQPPPLPVSAAVTLSPSEFGDSKFFEEQFPRFSPIHYLFPIAFLGLMVALLGIWPADTSSFYRTVMHYAGYSIFAVMWATISSAAKAALADIGLNDAIARDSARQIDEARLESRRLKIDDLQRFLPANNRSEPAMLRLLVRICQDAAAWRFDSLTNLIAPYQRESHALRLRVENLQRISLRLGILGAFVGLVMALQQLQKLGTSSASVENLGTFLPGFLSSLYLKFGASIGGLGASLYAYTLSSMIDRHQAAYFRDMEAATASLLDLASRSLKWSAFMDEFGQIREGIKDLQNEVHDQNERLTHVTKSLEQLAQVREQIGNFTSDLTTQHSKFLTDIQHLYDHASMERVFRNLEATLTSVNKANQEAIGQQFRSGFGNVTTYFGEVRAAMQALERSVSRVYLWTVGVLGATAATAILIWFLRNR